MTYVSLPLRSGYSIPQIGLGTYKMAGEDTYNSVRYALDLGYRHIDTAQMYGNEAEVGRALADSAVAREDIFLTTKLDNPNHLPEDVQRSFAESLTRLGTDYVDLFLIHWPLPAQYGGDFLSTWKAMEELVADGRSRSIGVSNFEPNHLDILIEGSQTVPAVNQIEVHPYFHNAEVVDYCHEHEIAVEAWAPLVRGAIMEEAALVEIAHSHGCTPAQAVLAWHVACGNIIFPKSVTPARLRENFEATAVELSAQEIALIGSLDRGEAGRTGYHPETMKRYGE